MKTPADLLHRFRHALLALCAAAWAAAFVASHVPADNLPDLPTTDAGLHTIGFFVLTALLLAVLASRRVRRLPRVIVALCAVPPYAAFDEITQGLVGRNPAFADWAADLLGMAVAVVVCELLLAAGEARAR